MVCPHCGSNNVNVQMVSNTFTVKKGKGCLYWLLIGWWLEILLWFFLTIPRLLILLFFPKNKEVKTIQKKYAICQNCGKNWKI